MRDNFDRLLHPDDVAPRSVLLAGTSRDHVDDEIRTGALERIFPRSYARPWNSDDRTVRLRAALLSAGRGALISHVTALTLFQLPVPNTCTDEIHVTVPHARRPTMKPAGLVIHRARRPCPHGRAWGIATVDPATAVVQSWPMLSGSDQRAPALAACRRGMSSPRDLERALGRNPTVKGRRGLGALIDLIADGCESELELWGFGRVFNSPGLRHGVRQRWISAGARRFRADLAFEAERVVVELDGRGYHSSDAEWDRDIERDRTLAMAGWQTVRFPHDRLMRDPDRCRSELLAILRARRDLLHPG